MSDPDDTKKELAWWGESPSGAGASGATPPRSVVTGSVTAKSDESPYVAPVMGAEQLDQLALALAERLKPKAEEQPFLGELAEAWFDDIQGKRVSPVNERGLLHHLKPLYIETEESLTVAAVSALLDSLVEQGYSPTTVNKVRGAGRHVVDFAMAAKRWRGPNPFALARRKREPQRQYELLSLEELERVQAHLPRERVGLFRVALHQGMRTGELFALRKEDVDLEAGTIHIHRSHGRDETKTGKARLVPIHPACAGDLLEASLASQGEFVFGDAQGELQRMDTKLTRIFRTAMARAGVGITSVTYKCRRRGCEAAPETHEEQAVRELDCMHCSMRLWPVPEVRPVRWYDLRHMCATFHHAHGGDDVCISIVLGHTLRGTTRSVYLHPDLEALRRETTRWALPLRKLVDERKRTTVRLSRSP